MDVDTLLLGLPSFDSVLLDSPEELFSGSGVGNVLDADVDALLHISVSDALVDDDANRGLCHVVDNTGLAVVDLEWHTIRYITKCISTESFMSRQRASS